VVNAKCKGNVDLRRLISRRSVRPPPTDEFDQSSLRAGTQKCWPSRLGQTSAHQSEIGKGLVHGALFQGLSSFEQPKWHDCIFCFQEREVRDVKEQCTLSGRLVPLMVRRDYSPPHPPPHCLSLCTYCYKSPITLIVLHDKHA